MPREKKPTTELVNIDEPSKAIKLYKITPAEIAERLKKYDHLKVIEGDTASYKEVRAALTALVHTRTEVDKRRLKLGEDLRKSVSNINQAGKMLIEPMAPYEVRFSSELKAEDDRLRKIREDKARIEEERKENIRAEIHKIQEMAMPSILGTMALENLRELSGRLEDMDIKITSETFQECKDEANQVLDDTYKAVQDAIAARIKLDKEAEERKAEDERLENIRKKQEADQKKIDEAQKEIDDDKAKIATDKKEAQDKKDQFRIDALFSIGLMWDGEQYGFMDINVHWTDVVVLSDNEFNKFIEDIRSKVNLRKQEETERIAKEATEKAEAVAAQKVIDDALKKEEKERAEEAEKERKEAARPDREKLINWIQNCGVPRPSLKTKEAKKILNAAWQSIQMILQDAMSKTELL